MKTIIILYFILNVCVLLAQGSYIVEVEFFGYSNPTGRCADCPVPAGQTNLHSCCDNFVTTNCTGGLRCDSYFYFCLRTLGDRRTNNGCSYFGSSVTFAITDDGSFNSSDLGIENPLSLPGLTNNFTGVQLYIEIFDEDLSPATAPDELVDIILVDLNSSSPGAVSPKRQNYTGLFNFVTMDLAVAALCAENYQPPDCMQCISGFTGPSCDVNIDDCVGVNCSGNGTCLDGINSFSCTCDPGYAGRLCNIVDANNCLSNPCGANGQCVDGINTFSCNCSVGFTGIVCDEVVEANECLSNPCGPNGRCVDGMNNYTCQCSAGYSGPQCTLVDRFQIRNLLAPLIGGSVGAFVLVILILVSISLVSACLMKCGKGERQRNSYPGTAANSDVLDIPMRELAIDHSVCALRVARDVNADPICSTTNSFHHPLRNHGILQMAFSPESSVNGFSRPASVQEREVLWRRSELANRENCIYADPQFDYQEQCVPDYLWQGIYENMDEEFIPDYFRENLYENVKEEEEQPSESMEHFYDYA